MGDRTNRGDPTPFAMSPDKAKKCGTWRKVKWDDKVEAQATFFADEKNLNKLYSPKEDVTLKEDDAPLAILVGPKTAQYVLKTNPSPAQLEKWADDNIESKEGLLVSKFTAMAA